MRRILVVLSLLFANGGFAQEALLAESAKPLAKPISLLSDKALAPTETPAPADQRTLLLSTTELGPPVPMLQASVPVPLPNSATFHATAVRGFLNLRASRGFSSGPTAGETPAAGRADLFHSIGEWTFQTGVETLEGRESLGVRQDTRLVREDQERGWRWEIGDLNVPIRGFQQAPFIAGLSWRRGSSVRPERTAVRLNASEILVRRESVVDFFVNGTLLAQRRLPAGRYDLREEPLLIGQNRVHVVLRDDLGQQESFEVDLFFEGAILEPGEQEFSYAVGTPWRASGADRAYDVSGVLVSAFHRYGLLRDWTVGLNVQNWFYRTMGGAEIEWMSEMGQWGADAAVSEILGVMGFASRGHWRSRDGIAGLDSSWRLGADLEYRSDTFFPVSVTPLVAETYDRRGEVQISKAFANRWIASAGLGREAGLPQDEERDLWRASLLIPFSARTRIEFSAQRARTLDGVEDQRGLVMFQWSDLEGRHSVTAFNDSVGDRSAVNVNRLNLDTQNDWRATASVQKNSEIEMSGFALKAAGTKGALRVDHFAEKEPTQSSSNTLLGAETAIIWRGSEFSLSNAIDEPLSFLHADQPLLDGQSEDSESPSSP